jgi:hypothetical protein
MQYALECECGRALPVSPTTEAAYLSCTCGRRVIIPLADEFADQPLILSAASLERRVRRLVSVGELPPPGLCACCGRADADVVKATLVCEHSHARQKGGANVVLVALLSPVLVLVVPILSPFLIVAGLLAGQREESVEVYGRDTDLAAPAHLCADCRRRLRPPGRAGYLGAYAAVAAAGIALTVLAPLVGLAVLAVGLAAVWWHWRWNVGRRQRALRDGLRAVPIYRQVLHRFPHALVMLTVHDRMALRFVA